MSLPINPRALIAAIELLGRARLEDWKVAVGHMDGIDDRMAKLEDMGEATRLLAIVAQEDAMAIAEGHREEAARHAAAGVREHAAEQLSLAFHHDALAAQADAYAADCLETWNRAGELSVIREEAPRSMTQEQYEAAVRGLERHG